MPHPGLTASLLLAAALAGTGRLAVAEERTGPCSGEIAAAVLVAVDERAGLRLDPPLAVRLADLRWPAGGEAAAARHLARHVGRPLSLRLGPPDRWGLRPAAIAASGGAVRLDFAEGLVESGLAMVDAGEQDRLCAPALLAIEETARERREGLWAEAANAPLPAADARAILAKAGGFAIVEGRVRSVGERRERTYLNFGPDWSSDFTVTMPRAVWRVLSASGRLGRGLARRTVRVRGLVEQHGGPSITLLAPEMLEILDEVRTPR